MQKSRGFTIVELIIAIAIIGILAAIAIPSYQEYLKKGRRADAQQFLSQVAQKQQQYLMDARAYATTIAELNLTPPTAVANFYDIVLAAPGGTPPTFTVTADAKNGTAQFGDGLLSIDHTGRKFRSVGGVEKDW